MHWVPKVKHSHLLHDPIILINLFFQGASATVVSVPEVSHPHSPATDSTPGIQGLEEAARAVREGIRTKRLHDTSKSPFDKIFTEEERIELTTRLLVRAMNGEGAGKSMIPNLELEKVIFEVVYPLFGFRQVRQVAEMEKVEEGWTCIIQ